MINSGAMRERVTIQKPVEQQSAFGETTLTWVDEATVYASVMGVRASDYFAAQQAGALVTHRIRIRFFPTITHEHRILWRDRIMEISSVLEREARSIHEILAREKAA
jgi:SPP1 family predicted phage head-tail adaptor